MLVMDQKPSEAASHYLSMSKTGASIDSYRMISMAAEDKISNNPSLSKLANHDRIVS